MCLVIEWGHQQQLEPGWQNKDKDTKTRTRKNLQNICPKNTGEVWKIEE